MNMKFEKWKQGDLDFVSAPDTADDFLRKSEESSFYIVRNDCRIPKQSVAGICDKAHFPFRKKNEPLYLLMFFYLVVSSTCFL